MYDTIIIGSGPAGLSAAIYAARAQLSFVVIEKEAVSGGQIINTYEVDNYPGLYHMNGFDLGETFRNHAEKLGASFVEETVKQIEKIEQGFLVHCGKEDFETKTVILATGAHHRLLGVRGEQELSGRGVSYCATCDGAFYRGKEVAVVGGGDVAVEDAIFLARMCKKVYLIHRRDSLRAAAVLQQQLFALDNVELVWDSTVTEIHGEKKVEELMVRHKSGLEVALPVAGVFIAVGIVPESGLYEGLCTLDEGGYVVAGEDCRSCTPGLFAAGDVRTKALRQVVTAAADGANAVNSVEGAILT
jgi:thioredoxin reductase (NADPH)